jgi:tRNA A-37 threonylcarbamoyl transferase component Bud32
MELDRQIDGVTVIERLGGSASADVYRGRDEAGRLVAIKVFREATERGRREAETVAALSHPRIVRTRAVFEIQRQLCVVMEWIDGGSLERRLESTGQLSLAETVRLGKDLGSALSYAHRHGILHRDIKPSNVLVSRAGDYLLADFGALGRLQEETSMTMAGEIAGTPLYMSPEQIEGLPQTPASDIFGLGLLLYRSVYGDLPGGNVDSLWQLIQTRRRPIDVPPSPLRPLLEQCLAIDPERRPPTADVVVRALETIALPPTDVTGSPFVGQPTVVHSGPSGGEPYGAPADAAQRREPATRRVVVVSAVVLALVAVGALVLFLPLDQQGVAPTGSTLSVLVRVIVSVAIAGGALVLARLIRRRNVRVPDAERRAASILFGAGQREALTQSLMIEVDQVVSNLKSIDARYLGLTVIAMIHEYEESRDSAERQAALLHVVTLMEKLQTHLSPWYIRYKDAIATSIAVVGALVGVAGVVTGFLT